VAVSKRAGAYAAISICAAILAIWAIAHASHPKRASIKLTDKAVTRKTLDNGLVVFARRSPPAGLVAIDVKILAGSSLEGERLGSGISHLVEHMVFKGTPTRPAGAIEREVKSLGGVINGSTSSDITDYHLLIPSKDLPHGLAIMKDMLTNAVFDAAETAKEKEVVLKEIDLNEDEPMSRLIKRLHETAYTRHPYRYPVIGYRGRFEPLGREDAVSYYGRMYVPNRMVLSIVGDIDEADAIANAQAEFGKIREASYAAIGPVEAEPQQIAPRRLDEPSRAKLAYLAIGFHSTGILDEDLFALDVLSMILGRGDGSRLSVKLRKKDRLVYSISAWNDTPRDPGMFIIAAMLDGSRIEAAERAVLAEIGRLRESDVPESELEAARRMSLADFIASLGTVDGQASDIGYGFIMTGSPDFSRRYVEGIQKVARADIRRVAAKYLSPSKMTVVRLIPGPVGTAAAAPAVDAATDAIFKETLPNGLRVIVHPDHRTPEVSITAAMLGGVMSEDLTDNGVSNLTAQMLLKGTASRKEDGITPYIESLGGAIDAFSGLNAFGVRAGVLKPDFATALGIIRDVLSSPAFPQDEIDKEKALTIAAISEEDDDIFNAGMNAMKKALYGDSVYGMRYLGTESSVSSLKRDDLLDFHRSHAVSGNIVVSISGDVDSYEAFKAAKNAFSQIRSGSFSATIPNTKRLETAVDRTLEMDKDQSLVLIGFETTTIKDRDRYALELLGSVLSGASGRIFEKVRNSLGMSYALGCSQKLGLGSGYFVFYAATARDTADKAAGAISDEISAIRQNGVTEEEADLAKKELVFGRRVEMQSNAFVSMASALDELYGLGHDDVFRYASAIEKVTAQDLVSAAKKYFTPGACARIRILSGR
jgi:zinc protease